MKLVTKKYAYIGWAVISLSILVLQVFDFSKTYRSEINKQERINFLNGKNYADQMELIIASQVDRVRQVSNVISFRIKDYLEDDIEESRTQSNHQNNNESINEEDIFNETIEWIVERNLYLGQNFDIAIKYVVKDQQSVIFGEPKDSLTQARYDEWLSQLSGDYLWSFLLSDSSEHIIYYGINRLRDKFGHTYDVIIEFNENVQIGNKFDDNHHYFVFTKTAVPLKVKSKKIKPVILNTEPDVGVNNDGDFIEQFYGKRPEEEINLTFVERYGHKLIQFNDQPKKDYYYNSFYFDELQLRFIILSDASVLADATKEKFSYFYKKIAFTIVIIIATGFIVYYHFIVAGLLKHDALTTLYNRNHFKEKSSELEKIQKRNSTFKVGIISIDIDKFKRINDTYGHGVGDKVIVHLSQLMLKHSRETDYVYRFGGEEFLIICPGYDTAQSSILAERLRGAVEQDDNILTIMSKGYTISLGVTEKLPAENMDSALKRADDLLYKAKNNGRNQVQVGDPVDHS
ncbi:GGDEF domain-containing protein [Thalassotalea sp. LPB0316]|uniref:GGDEF domain-containing protein n=1 Tax=Thalassotalea sp. LPB0316 TaxID=2769490 RepID=UPI00186708F4|nr:GGDEF domain-containing protein [Thalassotalea sp. LPB0316]QOL25103.1 GGDEF domain-containing protein [Thalassotalea sp. LPB0316]